MCSVDSIWRLRIAPCRLRQLIHSVEIAILLAPAPASLPFPLTALTPFSHLPGMHLGYPFYSYDRDDEPMYASFAAVSENAKSALATAQSEALKLFAQIDTSTGAVVVDVKGPHIVTLLRPGPSTLVSHRTDACAEFIRWARAHGFKAVARKITDAEKRAFYASKARKGPVVCVLFFSASLTPRRWMQLTITPSAQKAWLAKQSAAASPVKTKPRSQTIVAGSAVNIATPPASPVKAPSIVGSPVKSTAVTDIESAMMGLQV